MSDVVLPRSWFAGWLLWVIAAIALLVAATMGLSGSEWPLPLGVACICMGIRFADAAPRFKLVTNDPAQGLISLVMEGGETVHIPRDALTRAQVSAHTSSSGGTGSNRSHTTYGVALAKRDGGCITLIAQGQKKSHAQNIADHLDALLAATPADEEGERQHLETANRLLEEHPNVDLAHEKLGSGYRDQADTALVVTWSLAMPFRRAIAAPLATFGFAAFVAGIGMVMSSTAATVIAALFGALGIYTVMRAIASRREKQSLRVDRESLLVQRSRGDTTVDEKRIPVAGVDAVDVHWQQNLLIRLDGANDEIRKLTAGADGAARPSGILSAMKSVIAMTRLTMHVPTGALNLHTRLAIETVVGAEIARRSSRKPSEI